jgi:hypothetical protein
MRYANQSDQLQTALGGGFVHEQHREQTQQKLPSEENRAFGIATVWLVFFVLAVVNVSVATFSKVVDFVMASITPY